MKTKALALFCFLFISYSLFGQQVPLDTPPLAFPLEKEYKTNGAAFATRKLSPCQVYIDPSGTASINDIVAQQASLNWQDPSEIPQEEGKVYWVKTRLYGSVGFKGEKILHVSTSASEDIFSFDYVDSYHSDGQSSFHHQRTGDKVSLNERPFKHWAHFIKLKIEANDTVDLFVRLAGADARYLSPDGSLAVYQVDRMSLFPSQSNISFTDGLFYGVLAIQGIFFLLLFLIEKERIHFYFFLIVLGFFLVFGFEEVNFKTFMLFPMLKEYQNVINSWSYFFMACGFLKFIEAYFNNPKSSFISKWLLPVFISVFALCSLNFPFHFQYLDENSRFFMTQPYYVAILVMEVFTMIIGIVIAVRAPTQKNVSKPFFFLAFLPLVIIALVFLAFELSGGQASNEAIYPILINGVKAAVIGMLTLLALSMGYRTNRLKAEKATALQKNLDDQKQINKTISRFVPNEFLNALGKSNISEIQLGDTVQKEVTIFFSDIRNYSALAEQMSPKENFKFVNTYNGRMGPVIKRHQGFVNQYLGDGIMAIFPNSSSDALKAAIEMQQVIHQYNQQRKTDGKTTIKVGMGLHSGSLIMGIMGDENRMDATTISDSVNSASRIEDLTKHYGASILLSEVCLKKLDDPTAFHLRYLGAVHVKGKLEALKIYECFDGDLPESKKLKLNTLSEFEKGIQYYFEKSFAKATLSLKKVVQQNPKDRTAKLFLNKARTLDAEGVTEDWTGVEMMLKK